MRYICCVVARRSIDLARKIVLKTNILVFRDFLSLSQESR